MSAYPNTDRAIAEGRVIGASKPKPVSRQPRCPFCGGCPQCCDERYIADPDADPDGEVWSRISCPTCTVEGSLDAVEKPEDCGNEDCWRHGGKGSCGCDDETEGGVWQPGC